MLSQNEKDGRRSFDCFCKKVLKHEARDYYDEVRRIGELETPFTDLSPRELRQLAATDNYFAAEQIFDVSGLDIVVKDEFMAEALLQLPEQERNILLLYYFPDWNDREIGEKLGLPRSTVQHKRVNALKQLKEMMFGGTGL